MFSETFCKSHCKLQKHDEAKVVSEIFRFLAMGLYMANTELAKRTERQLTHWLDGMP